MLTNTYSRIERNCFTKFSLFTDFSGDSFFLSISPHPYPELLISYRSIIFMCLRLRQFVADSDKQISPRKQITMKYGLFVILYVNTHIDLIKNQERKKELGEKCKY